jgi:hypothetical protein
MMLLVGGVIPVLHKVKTVSVYTAFVGDTVITSNNYQRGQTYILKVQDLLAIQLSNITNCMVNYW